MYFCGQLNTRHILNRNTLLIRTNCSLIAFRDGANLMSMCVASPEATLLVQQSFRTCSPTAPFTDIDIFSSFITLTTSLVQLVRHSFTSLCRLLFCFLPRIAVFMLVTVLALIPDRALLRHELLTVQCTSRQYATRK